jgi:hypothetical protein
VQNHGSCRTLPEGRADVGKDRRDGHGQAHKKRDGQPDFEAAEIHLALTFFFTDRRLTHETLRFTFAKTPSTIPACRHS